MLENLRISIRIELNVALSLLAIPNQNLKIYVIINVQHSYKILPY